MTLDEETQWPILESVALALMIPATLYRELHKYQFSRWLPNIATDMARRKTCVHETGGGDNLARWIFLNGWNSRGLTRMAD